VVVKQTHVQRCSPTIRKEHHRFTIVLYELSNTEKIEILQQVALQRKSQREAFFPKTEIEARMPGMLMITGVVQLHRAGSHHKWREKVRAG
jgi:hypothetical protein